MAANFDLRRSEYNRISVCQKGIAGCGHRRLSFIAFILVGSFDHGYSGGGGVFGPNPAGAMVACQFLDFKSLDPFYDLVKFGIAGVKQGDMQSAITAVRLVAFEIFAGV